jgi:hypothetical protein
MTNVEVVVSMRRLYWWVVTIREPGGSRASASHEKTAESVNHRPRIWHGVGGADGNDTARRADDMLDSADCAHSSQSIRGSIEASSAANDDRRDTTYTRCRPIICAWRMCV